MLSLKNSPYWEELTIFLNFKHEHISDELQLTRRILGFPAKWEANGHCSVLGRKMN